jgi:hypothetical protein
VAVDPRSPEHFIFAGTDYGLYYTLDGGINWHKEYSIPNVAVHEVKIRNSDRTLFAFTHGRGIWYLKLKDVQTSVKKTPSFTAKISPNPVTNFLKIESSSPMEQIAIYNIQGKLVQTESGQEQTQVRMNLDALPKGIYFVKINAAGTVNTQRIIKQ